jgi:outer membrane receptor protein involved in Fe transport
MLADTPVTSGTALGSGRNKIFVRGIADSSFNGNTQSTVGLYLGDQRLTYSAPNPDLRLYDVETIEVLEGPQGTLYGTSTIGGLLRINPRRPDPEETTSSTWTSGALTAHGGIGGSLGMMANLPLGGSAALRTVAYGGHAAGYVTDARRHIDDINRSDHYGLRAALASGIGPDWTVELSAFAQWTETKDGQYVDASLPGLARQSPFAQPFAGRIAGGSLIIEGQIGNMELTSTTGIVGHRLDSIFARPPEAEGLISRAFDDRRDIRLLSHETRVASTDTGAFSWVMGVSALHNRDEFKPRLINSDESAPRLFADVTNRIDDYALFGEGSYEFTPRWTLTLGGRLSYTGSRAVGFFGPGPPDGSGNGDGDARPPRPPALRPLAESRNGATYFLPAAAISWHVGPNVMAYLRFHEGYRAGGVAIRRDSDRVQESERYEPDLVHSYEGGVRGTVDLGVAASFALTVFHTDWRDLQADVVVREGYPDTRNLGEASITGITAETGISVNGGWTARLAIAANETRLRRRLPEGRIERTRLPSTPDFSAHTRVAKQWDLSGGDRVSLAVTGRYVGKSVFDLERPAEVSQGDYASADVTLSWEQARWGLALEVLNVTDSAGNRFSFGNPFTVRQENQNVPQRPLTVRLSSRFEL